MAQRIVSKNPFVIEESINRFDGGMVSDTRDPRDNVGTVITNFDVLTNFRKMTPYKESESGDSGASTSKKQNFCLAVTEGTTYKLFGLGVVSGTARGEILKKTLGTGSSNDLSDGGWSTHGTTAKYQSPTVGSNVDFNFFVYYKRQNRIYGARTEGYIWRFDPTESGTADWADSYQALSYTNIAQGLVFSKDDILYIPYDNKIAIDNNGTPNTTAFTGISSDYVIRSICEYGNFLAIGCAPLGDLSNAGAGNSKIFLWDRDTTNNLASEVIDAGSGSLQVLEEVDGELISISLVKGSYKNRIVFRRLVGNRMEKFAQFSEFSSSTVLKIAKQKIDNRLYFMMRISIPEANGTARWGVWSIGKSSGQPFSIVHERTPNNDTDPDSLSNFFVVEDFMFISHSLSSTFSLSKTNNASLFTHTSIFESKKYDLGDPSITKELKSVTAYFEFLPTASAQVVVKYKKDEETSYTTIFTHTGANSISHSAINIESSGARLPQFREIQFRIESTAGAEITGFKFRAEIVDKDIISL